MSRSCWTLSQNGVGDDLRAVGRRLDAVAQVGVARRARRDRGRRRRSTGGVASSTTSASDRRRCRGRDRGTWRAGRGVGPGAVGVPRVRADRRDPRRRAGTSPRRRWAGARGESAASGRGGCARSVLGQRDETRAPCAPERRVTQIRARGERGLAVDERDAQLATGHRRSAPASPTTPALTMRSAIRTSRWRERHLGDVERSAAVEGVGGRHGRAHRRRHAAAAACAGAAAASMTTSASARPARRGEHRRAGRSSRCRGAHARAPEGENVLMIVPAARLVADEPDRVAGGGGERAAEVARRVPGVPVVEEGAVVGDVEVAVGRAAPRRSARCARRTRRSWGARRGS